jgi:hypothetical protein
METTEENKPSRKTDGEYAILMETNGKECESWMYFIRCEDNMEVLTHLQNQLEKVDWYVLDDLSVFELDLDHLVSAETAKQMTKVELNAYQFHRKFDGVLKEINLGFKKRDDNEKMMERAFDILGYGQIEDFIQDEDIDSEDMVSEEESESDNSITESDDEDFEVENLPSNLHI